MNSNTVQQDHKKQNFGLSANEFDTLLKELNDGNEFLFETIFKTHFESCKTFLVRKLGADNDVAYDITLETLIKFRKNLLAGKIKYGNMAALFTIDARHTYLRLNERETKHPHVSIELHDLDMHDDNPTNLDLELITNLKHALANVGNSCFEILNWHYYLGMPLRTIAEKRIQRGDEKFINESSVKTKIAECRKKLRNLLR